MQLVADEILACVMGGVYTDVEKTMIELEQHVVVQSTRSAFQYAMKDKFISEVERLSGRRVNAFISDTHVGPDLEIELFILEPPATGRIGLVTSPAPLLASHIDPCASC